MNRYRDKQTCYEAICCYARELTEYWCHFSISIMRRMETTSVLTMFYRKDNNVACVMNKCSEMIHCYATYPKSWENFTSFRASCLTLEINEFRCYEVKIDLFYFRRITFNSPHWRPLKSFVLETRPHSPIKNCVPEMVIKESLGKHQ